MPLLARLAGWRSRAFLVSLCIIVLLWVGLMGVRILFPIEFRDEILKWSAFYDLEPAWVASMIRSESRFRPQAVSSAGAIGLMQIMPETGRWIAEQLGLPDFETPQLADPALSIVMGTWYLRYLLDRFIVPDVALMAYNAGPTNAELWQGNLELAFSETQQYVRRIHLSIPVYRIYFAMPWLVSLTPSLHSSH